MSLFANKTLMITGGTGSFGNAVLNRFLRTDIGEIRIFSRDEKNQDDIYYDEVNLADMPKISLKSEGLDYAIDPDDTFWRRHDIISFPNFRQSKDEEVMISLITKNLQK